ncbi:MAG: two-component regulator propeller domain-containing protein [Bacteroidota bacterium]
MLFKKFTLLLLLIGFNLLLPGQQVTFKKLGIDNGLSQSSVYTIFQDSKGFMWFGTGDGLNRYDGNQIKTYKFDYNPRMTGNGNFYGLHAKEDTSNNIWFSNRSGLVMYDVKSNTLKRIFPNNDTTQFTTLLEVISISKNNELWFSNCHNSIFKYNINSKKMDTYKILDRSMGEKKSHFRQVAVDDENNIWYSLRFGIGRFNMQTYQMYNYLIPEYKLDGIEATGDFITTAKNTLLVANYKNVFQFNYITNSYKILLHSPKLDLYHQLAKDKQGRIWVGNLQNGLFVIDTNRHIYNYRANKLDKDGISTNIITALYIDASQNLWLGCDGFGLCKANLLPPKFRTYKPINESSTGLLPNFIKAFYVDSSDKLWIGTHEDGIQIIDRKTGLLKVIKQNKIGANLVGCFVGADNHKIYVGSGAGVYTIHDKNYNIQHIPIADKLYYFNGINLISKLIVCPNNKVIVASKEGLFESLLKTNGSPYFKKFEAIGTPYLISIYQTSDSAIYTSEIDDGFVYKFKLVNNKLELQEQILEGFNVRCMYEDKNKKTLWLASEKGLIKYNLHTKQYRVITTNNGLSNNYLYAVVPGNNDELWLSSNFGIMCYHTQSEKVISYDKDDGLQSNEFNTGAYYKSNDGEIFFGGINGFNSFFPDQIKTNPFVPNVVLTNLKVNDMDYNNFNYGHVKNISLTHSQNTLSFEFAALEFTNPEKNKYQYKLEGVDRGWVQAGKEHFARYPSLKSGSYVFKVRACNNDEKWSNEIVLLDIVILAPWWQTWWAMGLLAFILISLFIATIRYLSTRKLKQQLQELEKQQAVNQERTRISKDMHDDLGSGLSKIAIMTELLKSRVKQDDELTKQVEKISFAAGELVDNMGQIVWTMNMNNDTLENMLAYVREYAVDFFEDTSVACEINFEDVAEDIIMSQQLRRNIFLVIKETLNNSLKHAHAHKVTITFTCQTKIASIIITDDGVGFNINDTRKFGNGLINMRKRMEAAKGSYHITSTPQNGTQSTIIWLI